MVTKRQLRKRIELLERRNCLLNISRNAVCRDLLERNQSLNRLGRRIHSLRKGLRMSRARVRELEDAILRYRDHWESVNPTDCDSDLGDLAKTVRGKRGR